MPERAIPELADLLTKALISRDFALYRSVLTLPMRFTPRGEPSYLLTTEAELKADFDLYVDIMRLHGVTDIYRQLLSVTRSATGATAEWMTHILVRATLLTEPFLTRMQVVQGPEGWRIAEIESSEGHIHWTMGQAEVTETGFRRKDP